jgi:hypothetical protein
MAEASEMYVSRNGTWERYYVPPAVGVPHGTAINRDAPDSHPISAVTGLETALDAKSDVNHTHSDYHPATVSASAPAAPASGDVWINTSNNSIRVWNGSAWAVPKYRVGSSWKEYTLPFTPPAIAFHVGLEEAHIHNGSADYVAYGFDADAQGWHGQTYPANWSAGRLNMHPGGTGPAYDPDQSDYCYSPSISNMVDQGSPIGGWVIVTGYSWNEGVKPGTLRTSVNLYGNGLAADNVSHYWNYPGEQVRLDIPVFSREGYMGVNYQISTYSTAASAVTGMIPQYWNGSGWVPQSTA